MTHDTDESGHPFKIDICLEDDKGNTRKAFLRRDLEGSFSEDDQVNTRKTTYEDGLGALLVDPHFLLLHVPDDGGKMKIIQPANNLYHRNQMIKRINETKQDTPSCYYALSHLWGLTENNRYLWHEIGDYVDDEEGNPVDPVSMRPEKRDALLKLLKEYPDSYWWVDVLCARTDTPLDIMDQALVHILR
ncbi:predicted protein [Lichtheimia corymbifera JMRC:FSU:9682]|uniref:Heterokaryon incompatibility domain-containing protein n=1 Tax=Lichtheimia corymbifera JMRC:FSU:9682 TaxID=1263082 RepID=A0A068S245_9FUNG|nr:predicted protein [Lichtheimia corymbifera JMRC:FSU:9682]